MRFNGSLVITFTGNTNTDTDASNNDATMSRFQTAVAQVDTFTPATVEIGDSFRITIGATNYDFVATAATVQNVVE